MTRYEEPGPGHVDVAVADRTLSANKWYIFEISTFEGTTQVWIDGTKVLSYDDPNPLPEGYIGLEPHFWQGNEATFYYDNFSVCELSAPFKSIFETE